MRPRKTDETKVMEAMGKKGHITVNIPLSKFIKEHKNIVNILESGVQEQILKEAESQRAELDEIIAKVRELRGLETKKEEKIEPVKIEPPTPPKPSLDALMPKLAKPAPKIPMAPKGIPQALWEERLKQSGFF